MMHVMHHAERDLYRFPLVSLQGNIEKVNTGDPTGRRACTRSRCLGEGPSRASAWEISWRLPDERRISAQKNEGRRKRKKETKKRRKKFRKANCFILPRSFCLRFSQIQGETGPGIQTKSERGFPRAVCDLYVTRYDIHQS